MCHEDCGVHPFGTYAFGVGRYQSGFEFGVEGEARGELVSHAHFHSGIESVCAIEREHTVGIFQLPSAAGISVAFGLPFACHSHSTPYSGGGHKIAVFAQTVVVVERHIQLHVVGRVGAVHYAVERCHRPAVGISLETLGLFCGILGDVSVGIEHVPCFVKKHVGGGGVGNLPSAGGESDAGCDGKALAEFVFVAQSNLSGPYGACGSPLAGESAAGLYEYALSRRGYGKGQCH